MAGKRQSQDPVNAIKVVASTMLNSFLEDLKEKNVLNKQELQTMGQTVNVIANKTENLVGDLTEKTQVVGKIFKDHFFNSGSLLSLKSHAENEDECSESSSAGKRQSQDPVNAIKVVASTMLNSFLEDLKEKNVLNKQELQTMGQTVNVIANKTENLVGDLTEKTQVVGKIFKDHFFNSGSLLSLNISSDGEGGPNTPGLIICNSEFDYLSKRQGSEIDILGMQDLLENLGYSVVIKENLSALEMKTELKNFAARQEHKFSDSTFLVFMSHGTLDGICGTKHRNEEPDILHDDTIFQIFNNRNCRNLKDKPKVIIMQACRGRGDGAVWVTDVGEASAWTCDQPLQCYIFNDAIEKTHVEKDFIAFKSSTPHNVSWRLNTDGSLFISHLIHYFREFSCCHHLEEIFRKVQNSFETPNTMIQMPTIERLSMTRYFYLFPGN
ncbi:LOW QUALITY PROTEIN: caspase-12 [Vulpes vulpes]|uniref:LOW QUALITY PROTEIN: caspase-12 n=1 Tax=Vulpes vulpes TaxID=9627 RepID=A0ABM4Y6V9_VULVU|nr:LOW QUALITY PROTEIN: caspase-12-like [Vulpes lagopus]